MRLFPTDVLTDEWIDLTKHNTKEENKQVYNSSDAYKTTSITDVNYCCSQNNIQRDRPVKFPRAIRNWCKIVSRDPLMYNVVSKVIL
jgi:hypothetical protein